MKIPSRFFIALSLLGSACIASADDALFIGNSYTYGGPEAKITEHGGIPKLVEAIAVSKGKTLSTLMLTSPGKDWTWHLKQPDTDKDIALKNWNFVVLQDFSTEATHIGKPGEFLKNGETLYKDIREHAPQAKIVLYETWARPLGSEYYTGTSTAKTFKDIPEMDAEIQKNYIALFQKLEALGPGTQVLLAPVGKAFQLCRAKYPEINLNWTDKHHATVEGSYLASLVIYATIYQDSPKGATREFFGQTLDPEVAKKLQAIAGAAIAPDPATPETK